MSVPTPNPDRVTQLHTAWFEAETTQQQGAILQELVDLGMGRGREKADLQAVSTLIELSHLARHPRSKIPILRAMGRCNDHAFVVPSLLADLDDPNDDVVATALEALGLVGMPFGGRGVLRWLDLQSIAHLPERVVSSALFALARVGVEEAPGRIETAWREGLVTASDAHLALAEAASPVMRDEAEVHLCQPSSAAAAALHLGAIRHPELPTLLAPLLDGSDAALSLLAGQLLREQTCDPETEVLSLFVEVMHPVQRRRQARRLRAHDTGRVVQAFREIVADADEDTWSYCRVALQARIPALQDAVLEVAAAHGPRTLTRVLREVHSDTPALKARCREWMHHDSDGVAAGAVRALVSVYGPEVMPTLEGLRHAERTVHRLEWTRAVQNAWRNDRDRRGRSTLPHAQRRALSEQLRELMASDDLAVREMALYTAGNIGLTELSDDLIRCIRSSDDPRLRRAAATSLAQFPAHGRTADLVAALATESEGIVIFRLLRALLRVTRSIDEPAPRVAEVVGTRLSTLDQPARVLALALLGRCRDQTSLAALREAATSTAQAAACAAITGLGVLGSTWGLDAVLKASHSVDPERRCRAAEALGRIGGAVAIDRLLDVVSRIDEEHDVREAAMVGLRRCVPGPEATGRLTPSSLDDPLAVHMLELQHQCLGASVSVDEVDRSLEAAIEGFRVDRLAGRHAIALRALRTAEFFYLPGAAFPRGLDASPPVLYWAKGLEVWLNGLLRGRLGEIAAKGRLPDLAQVAGRWMEMRGELAPGWRDDLLDWHEGDLYRHLGVDMARQLASRAAVTRNHSLRTLAAVLLVFGEREGVPGVGRWNLGMGRDRVISLANGLVSLAHERNNLTHRAAGDRGVNAPVREVAVHCASGLAAMFQTAGQRPRRE